MTSGPSASIPKAHAERTRLIELIRMPVTLPERAQARVVVVDELLEDVTVVVGWELRSVSADDRQHFRWPLYVRERGLTTRVRRTLGARGPR